MTKTFFYDDFCHSEDGSVTDIGHNNKSEKLAFQVEKNCIKNVIQDRKWDRTVIDIAKPILVLEST